MRAMSDEGLEGAEGVDANGNEYRERYGERAFDQYMQEESQRDEQSQYDEQEEAEGAGEEE